MPAQPAFVYTHGEIRNKPPKKDRSRKSRTYYSGWQEGPYDSTKGEEALWKAVIVQAMTDALCNNRKPEFMQYKHEATHWLTANSKDFLEVCLRAGLDADYVRIRAKKAFANPGAWRTEAGQSARYVERKAKREAKKQQRMAAKQAAATPLIIKGPWDEENHHEQ